MTKLNWFFSENPKGTKQGYSDAGMETFRRSPYASIARESIQNSLDAHDGSKNPVVVRFEVKQIPVETIPGIEELRQAIQDSLRMWKGNKKAEKFFRGAIKLLKDEKLPILIVSDRNTKGLTGGDYEEGMPWDSLIRSIGASSKNEGEGGSFGIGSSAPFAASDLRTVFYSTRTSKTQTAFIGRTRLTTHETKEHKRFDPNGYLGLNEGERVEDIKQFPAYMRRDVNGTTLAILGFGLHEHSTTELAKAVLEHFWPAIHFGNLEVEFGKGSIKRANMGEILQKYASEDNHFIVPEFYRCVTEQGDDFHVFQDELKHLGEVELYLRTSMGTLPKRVAMIRKTGMVIKLRRFNSPIDYCGAFICRNDEGNAKLRDMEPPEHNEWSPNLPEHGANRKIDIEISNYVKSKIKELLAVDESKPLEVEGLGKYLPETDDDGKAKEGDGEGDTMPENAIIPTSPIGSKPPKKTSDDLGNLGPTKGPDDDDDDDESEPNDDDEGKGGGSGQPPGDRKETEVKITQRTFSTGKLGKKYTINVRPVEKGRHTVDLTVRIVGEDAVETLQSLVPFATGIL